MDQALGPPYYQQGSDLQANYQGWKIPSPSVLEDGYQPQCLALKPMHGGQQPHLEEESQESAGTFTGIGPAAPGRSVTHWLNGEDG